MKQRTIPAKLPWEFNELIMGLKKGFEESTGEQYSKTQVMRKMGNKLKNKLVVKGNDFDWRIF